MSHLGPGESTAALRLVRCSGAGEAIEQEACGAGDDLHAEASLVGVGLPRVRSVGPPSRQSPRRSSRP